MYTIVVIIRVFANFKYFLIFIMNNYNIILFIYYSNQLYDEMLNIQRKYINSHPNFKAYFITYNSMQKEDIVLIDDVFYIKGKESLLNITHKTLEVFKFLLNSNINFNFIIRSNMSTIINLNQLNVFLNNIPKTNIYCGGNLLKLSTIDPEYGIIDNKYFGLKYIQGTSIILSKDVIKYCVQNINLFDYTVVDDVSFALFFKKNRFNIYIRLIKHNALIVESSNINNYDACFFRCKTENRNQDIITMNKIVSDIYDWI